MSAFQETQQGKHWINTQKTRDLKRVDIEVMKCTMLFSIYLLPQIHRKNRFNIYFKKKFITRINIML